MRCPETNSTAAEIVTRLCSLLHNASVSGESCVAAREDFRSRVHGIQNRTQILRSDATPGQGRERYQQYRQIVGIDPEAQLLASRKHVGVTYIETRHRSYSLCMHGRETLPWKSWIVTPWHSPCHCSISAGS
jgi:hypothetical protein